MDKAIGNFESQRHTADESFSMLHADATTSRPMEGAPGSRGTSANDTKILVEKGSLPGLSIDDHSTAGLNACDTSYTKDDWSNDRQKTWDTLKKVDEIIDRKDFQAFKDVFSDPNLSPDVRKEFLNGGTKGLIDGAFGDSTSLVETKQQRDAYDYALYGQLSLPSRIEDEEGFFGLNRDGVEKALKGMTPEEKEKFVGGKLLAEANAWPGNGEQRDNLGYYNDVHETLKYASGYSFWGHGPVDGKQVETWEKEIESLPSAKTDSLDSCAMHRAEVKQEQKKIYDDQFQADVNKAAQKIVDAILLKERLFDHQTASQMEN